MAEPVYKHGGVTVYNADVRDGLRSMADGSVQCVVTSPPYLGLRSYLSADDPQKGFEIGTESLHDCLGWANESPCGECYVCRMVMVFWEVRRVLRDDGTLFLNLGDSYAANRGTQVPDGKHVDVGNNKGMKAANFGLKPKDLIGIPWRVAFALQADGWYLRSDCIWHKPNQMPESVKDRPTKAHEYLFLLSKRERYYYDADAVREPARGVSGGKPLKIHDDRAQGRHGATSRLNMSWKGSETRNMRTVLTIPTCPTKNAHFATFPPALVRPCILAGCPEGGTVLDPFAGSGTTLAVARSLCRRAVGIELNPAYVDLIRKRLADGCLDLSDTESPL